MVHVKKYLKQSISWEKKQEGGGFYDEATYAAPVQIKARYVANRGIYYTATGQEVEAEGYAWVTDPVQLKDKLEGAEVRRIEPKIGKRGEVLRYDCYL